MSDSDTYDWTKHWQPTLRGGSKVVNVYRDPNGLLLVVSLRDFVGYETTWVRESGRLSGTGESIFDLLPIPRTPELRAFTWQEFGAVSGHWFRHKQAPAGRWFRVTELEPHRVGLGQQAAQNFEALKSEWQHCADPFAAEPRIEECGSYS